MVIHLLPLSLLSPTTLLRVARYCAANGKTPRALCAADKALEKLTPKSSVFSSQYVDSSLAGEAWLIKAQILRGQGHYGEATNAFLTAFNLDALDVDGLDYLTGQLLQARDFGEQAQRIYLRYLSESHHAENLKQTKKNLRLLETLSAPNWSRGETINDAERWNNEITYWRDDLSWPYRHLGAIAIFRGDYYDAISLLEKACLVAPNDFKARLKLAFALFKTEDYEPALQHLHRLSGKQLDNRALLLRAHVLRALGNYNSAAADYRLVDENLNLSDEDRFCYIETCVNAGHFDEAAFELSRILNYEDERWILLCAVVDQAAGRDREALALFTKLTSSEQFAWQASDRILRLVAANPEADGALEALNAISEYYRDYRYWPAKGNVLLSLGLIEEALEAWSAVYFPGNALIEAIKSVGHHYFATLYASGGDRQIIRTIRRDLAREMDCPEVAEIVVSALTRYVLKNLHVSARHKRLLNDIKVVATYFPVFADSEQLDLLRGLVHAARFDYETAASFFSSLGAQLTSNDEIALEWAKCSLHAGATEESSQALAVVRAEHPEAAAIRCAISAINEDWDAAARHLLNGSLPARGADKFKAAALFKTKRWTDLEALNGNAGHIGDYYRAARLVQTGDRDSAFRILSSVPPDDPAGEICNQLEGWLRLQKARECNQAGERELACDNLLEAMLLWPQSNGPAAFLNTFNGKLIDALLQGATGVPALLGIIEAEGARHDPADTVTYHNQALVYFCNGVREAKNDNFKNAIESWERSIGYVAATLADDFYMGEWLYQRLQTYQTDDVVEQRQVENGVLQFYETTFQQWSEALSDRLRPSEAEKLANLGLVLRAELAGARLLRKMGGFPLPDAPANRVCAGPIFISMNGYEKAFATFITQLNLKYLDLPSPSGEEDPVAELMDLMERWKAQEEAGAIDPADKYRLERLFSVLRLSTILYEEGKYDAALTHLPPLRSYGRGGRENGLGAAARRKSLTRRSPAFARKGGAEDFAALARTFEVDLLVALGEQDIAAADDRILEGIEHWREALALASYTDDYLWTAGKVREVALGRANFLFDRDQTTQASDLLERVNELCGDEEVRSLLAKLYAVQGVKAANNADFYTAVIELRKATAWNSQSIYAQWNLANVLLYWVDREWERDRELTRDFLYEALQALAVCRDLDEHNEKYRDTQTLVKAKLSFIRIELGEITVADIPADELLSFILLNVRSDSQQS